MPAAVATAVCIVGILGLFVLDRDRSVRTSKALWIPVTWLLIVASRPVSVWLNIAPQTQSPEQYLEGSPLDRFVFLGLLLVGLFVVVRRGRPVLQVLRRNAPIGLYFSYCLASTFWSDYPDVALKRWIKAVGDVVMVLVILTDPEPLAALRGVLTRVGFVLLPLSVLFIKYYPDLGRGYDPGFGFWKPMYTGVTTNKNSLGGLVLIFGIGAVWHFLELVRTKNTPHRRRHFIAQSVLLVTTIWLLWMANSATSTSCFIIAACLIVATTVFNLGRKPVVIHFLVAAAVSLPLYALFLDPGSGLIESVGRNATLTGRTALWSLLLGLPVNRLFGTGFESFWLGKRLQEIWSVYWWHPNEAHNGYIEILLNLGWIGVTLLAILLVAGYRNIILGFRRDPNTGSLKLAYFTVAIIYSFTEAAFRMLGLAWIFLLLATAAIASTSVHDSGPSDVIDPTDQTDRIAEREPVFGYALSVRPYRESL